MSNICPICASNINDEISCPNCQWDLAEYKEDAKGFKAEKERRIKWGCNIWKKNQEQLQEIERLKSIINSINNISSDTLKNRKISKIKYRNQRYTKKFLIPQSEDVLSFHCTLDSYDSWDNSKPYKISFLGEDIDVNSWSNLYVECCNILYNYDKNIIFSFINNPDMNGKKRSYFLDYDYQEGKGEVRKVAKNLYVETNFSANHITNLIRMILNKYNIDISEFKIYLSKLPNKKTS